VYVFCFLLLAFFLSSFLSFLFFLRLLFSFILTRDGVFSFCLPCVRTNVPAIRGNESVTCYSVTCDIMKYYYIFSFVIDEKYWVNLSTSGVLVRYNNFYVTD
jgi:hypothetical protein